MGQNRRDSFAATVGQPSRIHELVAAQPTKQSCARGGGRRAMESTYLERGLQSPLTSGTNSSLLGIGYE